MDATMKSVLSHPFYPIEAEIVGYLANEWSVLTLLGLFAAGWVVILGATWSGVNRHNPTLPSSEKAAILWFVLCKSTEPNFHRTDADAWCNVAGTIHLFFEGMRKKKPVQHACDID